MTPSQHSGRQIRKIDRYWFCPLLERQIQEGHCLDINYERLGFFDAGVLKGVLKEAGRDRSELDPICETCPNQPLREEK